MDGLLVYNVSIDENLRQAVFPVEPPLGPVCNGARNLDDCGSTWYAVWLIGSMKLFGALGSQDLNV